MKEILARQTDEQSGEYLYVFFKPSYSIAKWHQLINANTSTTKHSRNYPLFLANWIPY